LPVNGVRRDEAALFEHNRADDDSIDGRQLVKGFL
jgi:hypothetical protein